MRELHSHDSLGIAESLFKDEALDFAASFAKNDIAFLVGLDLVIESEINSEHTFLEEQTVAETKLLLQILRRRLNNQE